MTEEAKKYSVGQRLLGISALVVILLVIAGVPGKVFKGLGMSSSSSIPSECESKRLSPNSFTETYRAGTAFDGECGTEYEWFAIFRDDGEVSVARR